MNSEQSLDLWSEVSIPQWMINEEHNQEENSFSSDSQEIQNKKDHENTLNSPKSRQYSLKRSSPIPNQTQEPDIFESIEDLRHSQSSSPDLEEKVQKNGKENPKNKMQKRIQNSRKYRQKKRQYIKSLQQQNKFLKMKIDQLYLKINQKQRQIIKLRHKDLQNTQTFNNVKSQCLRQVQQILSKNQASNQQLVEAESRVRKVLSFDCRHKLDYLNYFMSGLLQNIFNETSFYFMDCLIHKRGIYRENNKQDLRKIDNQVLQILNISEEKLKQCFNQRSRNSMAYESKRIKQLWKKLYQVYSAILNQGMKLQRIVQPMKGDLTKLVGASNILAIELHFEKNKYRSDIRFLRNAWFKQLQYQSINLQKQNDSLPTKKTKLIQ